MSANNLMTDLLHFLVSYLDGWVYHWRGSPDQKPNYWWWCSSTCDPGFCFFSGVYIS